MSTARDRTLQLILTALEQSSLPPSHTTPLREALTSLHAERPNAVDKVHAPLARALRNPHFPDIWEKAVQDIPGTPAYAPLRRAAETIAALVREARS